MKKKFDVIVVGGGAAGFFTAINIKIACPKSSVLILEKTTKLLSKVLVSGGGRCNVTHNAVSQASLSKAYPRGKSFLKKAFAAFWVPDLVQWFQDQGIALKVEEDGRMFPSSNQSTTIVNCFLNLAQNLGIQINCKEPLIRVDKEEVEYVVTTSLMEYSAKKLVLATGGPSKLGHLDYLSSLKLKLQKPCPSLFTFNLPDHPICQLQGLSVEQAKVTISSLKESWKAPLLITHWGMSGPAILVLSSICAKRLAELEYKFTYRIDWIPDMNREDLDWSDSNKQIGNHKPMEIPQRLWDYFLNELAIDSQKKSNELSKSEKNKLIELLKGQAFNAHGKTTFKEEFVTCGGVDLSEINVANMESKQHPGLFFAGELMDVDAITGGYNFQAAWTTAYIAAKNIALQLNES